jgi:ribonuclease P protein component
VSSAFPSGKRLAQAGVLAVLKLGKRLAKADFELRFLIPSTRSVSSVGKIAISVPKRLVKSSVARNRIKRLVREEFRAHEAAKAPLHMHVSYRSRNDGRLASSRRLLRAELAGLFEDAIVRARAR